MSKVRSAPLKSAVLKQAQLDQARPAFERLAALVLLGLSFLGSIAAFHAGDWAALRALRIDWVAVVAGVALQAVCTAVQYLYRHKRLSPVYLAALVFDAGPTALGYAPIVAPSLLAVAGIIGLSGSPAAVFAYGVIVVAAVLLAWVPESRLID